MTIKIKTYLINLTVRNSLIWNAVPTIFATPNPVPLEEVTRPPRKNRKAESVTRKKRNYKKSKVQVNNGEPCEHVLIVMFITFYY